MKATTQDLIKNYSNLQSVWKVAEKFSMCGQSVHERLKKAGIQLQNQKISEEERRKIREIYEKGFKRGDSALKDLSNEICRTIPLIARTAKEMGLTNASRGVTDKSKENASKRLRDWLARVSQEEKNKNRQQTITTKRANGNDNQHRGNWKAEWRTIGGKKKFFRSRWEANYARYLEFLKINNHIKDWLHEPETFWFEKIKRGTRSYLPDFKVLNLDGSHEWREVKGWMDNRSKTKLKRFAKYYPKEKMTVIDKKWFSSNSSKMRIICPHWE